MYSQEQLELAVKEAANFAYEQGKIEMAEKIANFIESLAQHPTQTPSLDLVATRIRGFDA
jgi:hypothetical protein